MPLTPPTPLQRSLRIRPTNRVIMDNDWGGDPDGLLALIHHLLSPSNVVVAVTSSFLHPMFGPSDGTAMRGAELAREAVALSGIPVIGGVHAGPDAPFSGAPRLSDAAAAIIAEAERDDDLPLYVVCGGPLTNIADALAARPELVERFTLVWIGGSLAADVEEYNRDLDPAAAGFVFGLPGLPVWQFPLETYRSCAVSAAEMQIEMAGAGRLGAWIWGQFVDLPVPDFISMSEVWAIGDSPPILITALTQDSCTYDSPSPNRRVYTAVDTRLIFADLLSKLRKHALSDTAPD